MERQAKDGTMYRQVGPDEWEPITRQAKDGTVFKKVGPDDWEPLEAPKPQTPEHGAARSALEGYAESSSFGTLPYLKAAGEYVTDKLAEQVYGVPVGDDTYDERVARARAQSKEIKEANPKAAMTGEIAGFLAPSAVVSKVVGTGVKALAGSSKLAAAVDKSGKAKRLYDAASKAKELGNVERAARLTSAARADLALQGLRVGAEGAAMGLAYTPESGFSDVETRLKNAGAGGAVGAVMPAAFRAAGQGVKATGHAVAKGTEKVGKKVLSSLGGVSEEVIDRYLKNPDRIRAANTFDELYDEVSGIVGKMGDDLEKSRVTYEVAKQHLDEVAQGIKNSRVEGKEKALEQVAQARATLDHAFSARKQSIAAKASPTAVEPMVSDAITGLKQKVREGSGEAFEILGDDVVPVQGAYDQLNRNLRDLAGRGSDSAKRALGKIKEYGDLLHSKGQSVGDKFVVPAKELKRIIQDIDHDISTWNAAGGSFDDAYNASLKTLRASLDEQLKASSPAYKAKMAEVAENAGLLGQASERFGKPDRAINRLGGLDRTSAKYDLETLQKVSQKAGGDLGQAVEEMVQAQRTLKSPTRLESIRQGLPESQSLRQAEMQAAATKRLAKPKLVKEAIKRSAASFQAQSAKAKFEAQKDLFNRFKSFGEQGAESKLRQVAQGRKHAEKVLRELSDYSDKDFVEAVKAAQDAAAFNKTMFHGSRNVNLWTVMGALGQSLAGKGGAGAAAGGVFAGPVGMAVGAVMGGMVDVYGPQVTRKILDGVIRIKGPITEKALLNLNIPPQAKAELVRTFRASILAARAAEFASNAPKLVADKDAPKKGPDKWVGDGFQKVLDHAGPQDRQMIESMRDQLMKDPKSRNLLINASDLKPGSKALDQIIFDLTGRRRQDVSTMEE